MITDDILKQFKQRMRITFDCDDDNLRALLERSYSIIKANCGNFDLSNDFGKFLVFEHSRYTLNDDSEFFMENFQYDLKSFSYELRKGELLNESETDI